MEPTFSGNPLKDVHDNVKAGIIVTLRTKDKYFCLHSCSRQYIVGTEYLLNINLDKHPELLDEGEWLDFLECAGVKQCTCNINGIVKRGVNLGRTINLEFAN